MNGLAVADKRLTPECNLSRGCGGVGIAWKKHLVATPALGVKSDKICAITVETTMAPILIIGVYLPTSDTSTDIYQDYLSDMENLINNHPQGPVVIAGDFNAHVGPTGGPRCQEQQNVHGRLLSDLVDHNDLFFTSLSECTKGHCYTFFSGDVRTTTDYIITNAVSPLVSNYLIQDHHPLNSSDHLPLSVSLNLSPEANHESPILKRLDWKKGSCDGSTFQFATGINALLRPLIGKTYTSPSELEEEINSVATNILQSASTTIPQFKPRKPRKRFTNNPELKYLSSKCKEAWKKWCDAGRPREGALLDEKKNLKRLTKNCANKCCARIERQTWQRKEQLFKDKDPRRFKTPPTQPYLGDKLLINEELSSDPQLVQSCWVDHFSTIAKSKASSNPQVATSSKRLSTLASLSELNCDDIVDDVITTEEVEFALKRLKCRKAGGIDCLLPEHLKYGGSLLTIWLKQIFNAFIQLEHIPACILTGITRPIYKGKGKDPFNPLTGVGTFLHHARLH